MGKYLVSPGRAIVAVGGSVLLLTLLVSGCAGDPDEATEDRGFDSSPTEAPPSDRSETPPADSTDQDPAPDDSAAEASPVPDVSAVPDAVRVGADVLRGEGFSSLAGQRVGVILNQASTVEGGSLLDLLVAEPTVEVVAAFGPEHGVRGTTPAGVAVDDSVDVATGVPLYSLYGDQRVPAADVLATLDVLVFDLQDVGARPYTYISTMGLAMQAAADANVAFMVLDRPNPLGGELVSGWLLDPAFESFVGQYPIPMVHGLTTGELALMIQGEGWLAGLDSLDLQVVPLHGWRRAARWPDLGRGWVPPSPGLSTWEAAAAYPGTVLFEATSLSFGRGTAEPFTTVGAPWVDGEGLAERMNELGLPGVRFEPARMRPEVSESAPNPPFAGEDIGGVRIVPVDGSFRPFETGVQLLVEVQRHAKEQGVGDVVARADFLDLLAGTDELRLGLAAGQSGQELVAAWSAEVATFETLRQPYLLYP